MRKGIEMIAGLPGIGISGIFYLVCAVLMPIVEVMNTLQRRSSKKRWKTVGIQFSLCWAIITGSWGTGLMVGAFIHHIPYYASKVASHSTNIYQTNVFRMQPLVISLVTLCAVIASMRIINYFRDRKFSFLNKTKQEIRHRRTL